MLTFLMIIATLVAIILMAVVLIQNPKGSGLASNFSTGNQFFGVKKTTDIVEKLTWISAGIVIVISLVATSYLPKSGVSTIPGSAKGKIDSQLEEIMEKGLPATTPIMPSTDETTDNQNSMQPSEGLQQPAGELGGQEDQPQLEIDDEGNPWLIYPDGRKEKLDMNQ